MLASFGFQVMFAQIITETIMAVIVMSSAAPLVSPALQRDLQRQALSHPHSLKAKHLIIVRKGARHKGVRSCSQQAGPRSGLDHPAPWPAVGSTSALLCDPGQ